MNIGSVSRPEHRCRQERGSARSNRGYHEPQSEIANLEFISKKRKPPILPTKVVPESEVLAEAHLMFKREPQI